MKDLNDMLRRLEATNFLDVVLCDHPPLALNGACRVDWRHRRAVCGSTRRSITSGVGTVCARITGSNPGGLSWPLLWLPCSEACTVGSLEGCPDSSLPLDTGPNQVVSKLVVKADV